MKKYFSTLLLILIVFLPIKNAFSNYYATNSNQISIQTKKTSLLLKKHVITVEKQLIFFKNRLDLKNDERIKSWLSDINKINNGLDAIKNDKIDALKANILIKSIINRLKTINNNLKPYLKKKLIENKSAVKIVKNKYYKIIIKFNNKLKQATNKVIINLKKKKVLNSKDKAIIYHLENIKNYIKNLDNFNEKDFYSVKELKLYLITNIKSISNEIGKIKNIMK